MDRNKSRRPFNLRRYAGTAALSWATAAGALLAGDPPGVFLSEYVEGTSSNHALEIFNGSASTIDLAAGNYYVQIYLNGSLTPGANVAVTGVLLSGGIWVVADSSAVAELLALADQTPGNLDFTGNDAIVLRVNGISGTVIDRIGRVGEDPGSVGWSGGGLSTANRTLQRDPSICQGDSNTSDPFDPVGEWVGWPLDDFSGLGEHTSTCSAYLFVDGFESSDTSRWSETVPAAGETDPGLE